MSKDVVSFKIFKTADDFEKWQVEENPKIISVSPVANELGADIEDHTANAEMRYGCFVQFWRYIEL